MMTQYNTEYRVGIPAVLEDSWKLSFQVTNSVFPNPLSGQLMRGHESDLEIPIRVGLLLELFNGAKS